MNINKTPEEDMHKIGQDNFYIGNLAPSKFNIPSIEAPSVYGQFHVNELEDKEEIDDLNGLLLDMEISGDDSHGEELLEILCRNKKKSYSHSYSLKGAQSLSNSNTNSHPKISLSGRVLYSDSAKNLSSLVGDGRLGRKEENKFPPERVRNPLMKNFI